MGPRPTLSGTTTEQLSLKCSLPPSSSSALPGGSITCMRKRCVSKVSLSSCYCGGRYIMWLHDDGGKNDPPTLRLSQIYKFRKAALLSLFGWCCWALSRGWVDTIPHPPLPVFPVPGLSLPHPSPQKRKSIFIIIFADGGAAALMVRNMDFPYTVLRKK